jgi:nicotinamide-nucleotide amidase
MGSSLADLFDGAVAVADLLVERGETVAVAESSAGGLLSAALLSVPGASAYYVGGTVSYSLFSASALLGGRPEERGDGLRGATAQFAEWQARSIASRLGADWGVAETGVAGPDANRHGVPPGTSWICVIGPGGLVGTMQLHRGSGVRLANMVAFAAAGLSLLRGNLQA